MRLPIIGITGVYSSESGLCGNYGVYFRAVAAAGGVPVVIPCMTDLDVVKRQVDKLDGIISPAGQTSTPSTMANATILKCR